MSVLELFDSLLVFVLQLADGFVPLLVELLVLEDVSLLNLFSLLSLLHEELLDSLLEVLLFELFDSVLCHFSLCEVRRSKTYLRTCLQLRTVSCADPASHCKRKLLSSTYMKLAMFSSSTSPSICCLLGDSLFIFK